MAEANRKTTYDSPANREDLVDIVYNVDPWETPFATSIASVDATAVNHEWPIDELAAASGSNANLEGDDTAIEASVNPVRRGNYCQILKKSLMVSGTQIEVRHAAIDDEVDYQIVKKTKEIRTDLETSLLQNVAKDAGDKATTARVMAGYPTWVKDNFVSMNTGVAPATDDGTSPYTPGTLADFTEDKLKEALETTWTNGGNPDCLMVQAGPKGKISAFAGNATRMKTAEDRQLIATIDIYDGDFHQLEIKANRFGQTGYAYIAQTDMWALAELRSLFVEPLGKTGDAEKWQLVWEATLEARNQKSSSCVADVQ